MPHAKKHLERLNGKWTGTCKTWLRPDELLGEDTINGEFTEVISGCSVRHCYSGTIQGKKRTGEELIAFNAKSHSVQVSWQDSFHMSEAIMFSEGGPASSEGFSVTGEYGGGEGQPNWRWRTEYRFAGNDQVTITAFNITPDGQEAKAVELKYKRQE